MSFKSRFLSLTRLHRQLDDAMHREMRGRGGDPFRILRLRTLKLSVKARLAALMRAPALAR